MNCMYFCVLNPSQYNKSNMKFSNSLYTKIHVRHLLLTINGNDYRFFKHLLDRWDTFNEGVGVGNIPLM